MPKGVTASSPFHSSGFTLTSEDDWLRRAGASEHLLSKSQSHSGQLQSIPPRIALSVSGALSCSWSGIGGLHDFAGRAGDVFPSSARPNVADRCLTYGVPIR